ncbi:hypothetical protein POTOM_005040 [Populus tomentosa]|uniref:Protein NRT1/ PTR FAMILY 1.2-like n=1 Tax=Populus tomentosa TaxID=118781 RepID=A0A8X8DE68_POPTO|nr:hypothetical protein POTOM_005040 [Populus tomentosa]
MEKNMEEPLSSQGEMAHQHTATKHSKGGLITMPFIIGTFSGESDEANEAFEKVASYGLIPNMILYLMRDYSVGVAKGTNILFFWTAGTNFMPILGALISDSYLGRFLTIGLGSISSLLAGHVISLGLAVPNLYHGGFGQEAYKFWDSAVSIEPKIKRGMILLWFTAMVPKVRPPPCDITTQSCKTPTTGQMTLLLSSFALMSIGAGGVRPCSIAFGADQLDNKSNPKNERVLESFFGWYYASAAISVLISLTAIVYIQDHLGWKVGFGVPAILMFLSALLFFFASPFYVKQKPSKSLFTGFIQVPVVAYKNRKLAFPPRDSDGWYHHKRDSKFIAPTTKLRFLNKACIIRNPEQDIASDGSASNPWSLCTIEQVEELKALLKVIPLWSTGIMISINISQSTFQLLQASSMDRHISSSFQIPAGSFGMFTIISLATWVILYDRAILPLASKIKGKPVQLGAKLRMGIGLFLSCMAMVVSAIVESIRRRKAIQEGYLNNAHAVLDMSAMWLVPQHCLNGLAEAFNAIGQTEFYYSEFPKSMSSIAAALFGLGMAVANLLASAILSAVDKLTSRGGKESWVSNNINKGHYDNYYWLLAIMSSVNLLYFLVCSWAYGPCVERVIKVSDEGNGFKEEELSNIGAIVKDEV